MGLQNFRDAFNDEFVGIAFKNTVLYGLVIVPCVVVIGFAFALYVNQRWPLSASRARCSSRPMSCRPR